MSVFYHQQFGAPGETKEEAIEISDDEELPPHATKTVLPYEPASTGAALSSTVPSDVVLEEMVYNILMQQPPLDMSKTSLNDIWKLIERKHALADGTLSNHYALGVETARAMQRVFFRAHERAANKKSTSL